MFSTWTAGPLPAEFPVPPSERLSAAELAPSAIDSPPDPPPPPSDCAKMPSESAPPVEIAP